MECGCDDMRGSGRESMGKAITKDSVFDSMRRVEAALKLRYMGIGFVWAWLYCTYATSAVFPYRSGQSINSDESWLLSAVAVVLGFFVGGLLLSRRPLGARCLRRFSIAAALLLAAGTIVSALGAFALGLAWLGGAMTGVGYALLSLLWARALMVLDVEELEAVVPLSSLVIVPCVVVYPLLEGVVGVVATASLPLMSGVLLLLCLREGAKRCGVEEAASGVGGMSPYFKEAEASGRRFSFVGCRRVSIPTLRNCRIVGLLSWTRRGCSRGAVSRHRVAGRFGRCPRQYACAHRS